MACLRVRLGCGAGMPVPPAGCGAGMPVPPAGEDGCGRVAPLRGSPPFAPSVPHCNSAPRRSTLAGHNGNGPVAILVHTLSRCFSSHLVTVPVFTHPYRALVHTSYHSDRLHT
eukprot:357510-Chlamydomonas_euryale.AAC.9